MRNATLADLEAIYQIELECFTADAFSKQQFIAFLKAPNFVNFIATLNGKPAGFIIGTAENLRGQTACHIYSLGVRPEYRRRGIGSSLLDALERAFAEKGVKVCFLMVRVGNVAAERLYAKHGYMPFETVRGYYGLGVDGLRLGKELKPQRSSAQE